MLGGLIVVDYLLFGQDGHHQRACTSSSRMRPCSFCLRLQEALAMGRVDGKDQQAAGQRGSSQKSRLASVAVGLAPALSPLSCCQSSFESLASSHRASAWLGERFSGYLHSSAADLGPRTHSSYSYSMRSSAR